MKRPTRNTLLTLLCLFFAAPCVVFCAPSSQESPQSTTPSNRPPQSQVLFVPAPMQIGQLPPEQPLPADARKPDRILRVGHKGSVQALAFSPDGRWLASGGDDSAIVLWNVSTGREEFRLEAHKGAAAPKQYSMNKQAISALAFNRDGTRLVSVEVSGIVRVWNLQNRKILFTINPHRIHYYGGFITYSADGKSLIVAVEKRAKDATETAIGFYEAETGKLLRTIPTKWNFLSTVVPTRDGRLIAAGTVGADDDDDPSGSVEVLDVASGEVQRTFPVVAPSISPDGKWMASFENSGTSHSVLWSLSDGKRAHDLTPQNASRVIFRPDGEEAAIPHGDSDAIDFVSTSTGQITKSLPGGGYGLGTVAYSADGKLLAAGSYSFGTIKVWNLASMKEQVTLYGQSPVQNVAFSPDGRLLAATSGELRVWDVSAGSPVVTLTDAPVSRAVFSADGKWLAANPGGQFPGKTLKIWSTETWKEAGSFTEERGFPAFWFGFSEEKSAPSKIHNAWSWPAVLAGETRTLWASSQAIAVSPDGKWLAQSQPERLPTGAVEICDAATGERLQTIPAYKLAVIKIAFSRDGRRLVTVGQDSNPMMVQGQPGVMIGYPRVSVWDTKTWSLEFSITFSTTAGADAEISSDGKLLAVMRGEGTQLFDLEQKKAVAAFASPEGRGGYLAMSPDATLLVQGAPEGVRVWKTLSLSATP